MEYQLVLCSIDTPGLLVWIVSRYIVYKGLRC